MGIRCELCDEICEKRLLARTNGYEDSKLSSNQNRRPLSADDAT
jgi:hypothetical protein